MMQPLFHARCSIVDLKVKGSIITELESKVLQMLLLRNRTIQTLDLSDNTDDQRENFAVFMQKFDQYCTVKYLTMDNMQPDMNNCIDVLGAALGRNTTIEVLNLRSNTIKHAAYAKFWEKMASNTSVKKISVEKTGLADKTMDKLVDYILSPNLKLIELDLSKNLITDVGVRTLCMGMMRNTTILTLNLEGNSIKADGCSAIKEYLSGNKTLLELSVAGNKINNDGIKNLCGFLKENETLKYLDISKNQFNDLGFHVFAKEVAHSHIHYLDISKNNITDEQSLVTLA
jgi:Ran GTPase-activating protein (RanGAP) involved in mRNA processing and transport